MNELSEGENNITVLDPEMLAATKINQEQNAAADYLMKSFAKYSSNYMVLPYLQE